MPRQIPIAATLLATCLWAAAVGPLRAEPAPDFLLTDLDGKSHSLANYRGRALLLNFWSVWCNSYKRETPSLVRLHNLGLDGLGVLGVTVNDAEPNVRAFVDQQDIPYPVVLDDDAEVATLYDIEVIPTNVIIDGEGEIHARFQGFLTVAHFETTVLRSLYEIVPRAVEPSGKAAVTWAAMKSR